MSLDLAPGRQPLASERSVVDVVRDAVGSQATVDVAEWHVRRANYVVASVETKRPSMRLVVKLEIPGERPNRQLDSMAAIARLVREQTDAPTFDVVAADTTPKRWPWEYLFVTELVARPQSVNILAPMPTGFTVSAA